MCTHSHTCTPFTQPNKGQITHLYSAFFSIKVYEKLYNLKSERLVVMICFNNAEVYVYSLKSQ